MSYEEEGGMWWERYPEKACAECGGQISQGRLRILPNTRHCVRCAATRPTPAYRMVGSNTIIMVYPEQKIRV